MLRDTSKQPRSAHPGDPFGTVFAWMRADDPGQAMIFLADMVADLDPPVTLGELLRWMQIALPHDFTGYDYRLSTGHVT